MLRSDNDLDVVLVVGAAGSVGSGITEAFRSSSRWEVIAVDPDLEVRDGDEDGDGDDGDVNRNRNGDGSVATIVPIRVEDVPESTFRLWFADRRDSEEGGGEESGGGGWGCSEVIYAAEDGNRDSYDDGSSSADAKGDGDGGGPMRKTTLGSRNSERFRSFAHRVAGAVRADGGADDDSGRRQGGRRRRRVHISYAGGSWTRREPSFPHGNNGSLSGGESDGPLPHPVVGDASPAKSGGGSNPYEVAKTLAESVARSVVVDINAPPDDLDDGSVIVDITFLDYISVVPNYAPNFSMGRMVRSALETGIVRYSDGDYGRPLLHAIQAGEAVAAMSDRRRRKEGKNVEEEEVKKDGVGRGTFKTALIPGAFVPFSAFAEVAREVVTTAQRGIARGDVRLEPLRPDGTPEHLRSRCISNRLWEEVGFLPDRSAAVDGLRDAATKALEAWEEEKKDKKKKII